MALSAFTASVGCSFSKLLQEEHPKSTKAANMYANLFLIF